MSDQKTINDIVWRACDTFRGTIDPSQYKDYILVMLFVKYLSDLRKEKLEEYSKRYGGDKDRIERAMALLRRGDLSVTEVCFTVGCASLGTFARLQARDADIVQAPIEQPYGVRDCAVRDPAGNLIRINELR